MNLNARLRLDMRSNYSAYGATAASPWSLSPMTGEALALADRVI